MAAPNRTAGLRAISAVSPTHRGVGQGLLGSAWNSWWSDDGGQPAVSFHSGARIE